MATIVAPDVCRFTFVGEYLSKPCLNTLDMVVLNPVPISGTRSEHIQTVANTLLDAWAEEVAPLSQQSYSFDELRWIDLDSEDGEVGSLTATQSRTLPVNGGGTGEPYTAAVAALVTKVTARQRGLRQGRLFLAPPDETNIAGNILSGPFLAVANANLSDFVERITETSVLDDAQYFPTVVHTRNAGTPQNPNVVYVNNTQITDFQMSGRVSTQRRRNRP